MSKKFIIFTATVLYVLISSLTPTNAAEIEITDFDLSLRQAYVSIHGEIVPGDFERLASISYTIRRRFPGSRIAVVALRSTGGNLLEASKLAGIVQAEHALTMVGAHQLCASACVLVFAAGSTKLVGETSQIEVHRASMPTIGETDVSKSVTIDLADLLAKLSVPPAIIGKLVTTSAGTTYTLTPSDLRLWGATVVNQ